MSPGPDRSGRPWSAATAWMTGCSVLFLVAYNAATWVTARRSDVGTCWFAWELSIPFVPAMIVPYWSLDLLFVLGFFVCTTRDEVALLGRRIGLAILGATVCFLLVPLRLGFPRPPVEGFLGSLFDLLRSFDQPFNLCPSLHIALRTLLADTYLRHGPGPVLRVAVHGWFSLIGLSTLLTWQHHLVDVAGGFALAAVCFWAVRPVPGSWSVVANPRIAGWYGTAAFLCLGAAWPAGLPGILLLWPALAFGLMALAYLRIGTWIYGKQGPRIPLSARLVMAPCLVGQELSRRWYARRCRPWDEAAPGVWIGRKLDDREADIAIAQGVRSVVDLTAEFTQATPFLALERLELPVLDLTRPTLAELERAVDFITRRIADGTVYVHCKIGYSRSAAVVGAYLIHAGLARDPEEAVARLVAVRPSIVVRPEAWEALAEFAARRARPA